jgi:hypothetical protein
MMTGTVCAIGPPEKPMRGPLWSSIGRLAAFIQVAVAAAPLQAGVYYDLGQPFIGAWRQGAWVFWDPVRKRDLLWSQECSQDGAVLFALDLENGQVLEEHVMPAREIEGMLATKEGILYLFGVSGLNQPGNELLRWDPHKRKIDRLGLPSTPENRLAGSGVIGRDGNVYVGTHRQGRLYRFNTANDTWEDLGPKVPEPVDPRQDAWLRNPQQLTDGTILATIVRSASEVVAINPVSGAFHKVEEAGAGRLVTFRDGLLEPTRAGFRLYDNQFKKVSELTYGSLEGGDSFPPSTSFRLVSANDPKGLLLAAGRDLVRADIDQKRIRKLATLPFNGVLFLASDDRVVVVDRGAERFAVVDLKNGDASVRTSSYRGKRGTQICGLNKASDGSIYATDIIGMHICRHDPQTGETRDLGYVGWPGGEVYNTIDYQARIYFGSYTGGYWGVYDPRHPWKPDLATRSTSAHSNPRNLGQLGGKDPNSVNRPFEYVLGPNERIYIACQANYGHSGGALAEFDPTSNAMRTFRDLKRSIQTVTADDRYVFAGTSIHGGRGGVNEAETATLVVHDPQTGKRVFEEEIIPGAKAIVCLRYSPKEKLFYGTTDHQVLFTLHPRSFKVQKTWKIRSPGTPLAGVPEDVGMIHITPAQDGNVYGVTSRDLFRLNVPTGKIEYLDSPPIPDLYQIVEGNPGELYMGARTHLLKYLVKTPVFYR